MYPSFQRMFAKEINKLHENIYTACMKTLPAYLYRRVIRQGPEETAESAKCLLPKFMGLSSIPSTHTEIPGLVAWAHLYLNANC